MLSALFDLVLPRSCAGCGLAGSGLCAACRSLLTASPLGQVRPDPCPPGLPPVAALAAYDGAVKHALIAHKERGRLHLTAPLSVGLAAVVGSLTGGPSVLCPVPSSRAAVRARGYDHSWRLARTAARHLRSEGTPVVARRLLEPARVTADQAGLTSAERAANLHGALRAANLHGALRAAAAPAVRVVVVDDVVTTGATLVEAARALTAAGHDVVGCAVVGATVRRTSPSRGSTPSPRAG